MPQGPTPPPPPLPTPAPALPGRLPEARRFTFERDTFAFANELVCEYVLDPAGGRPRMVLRRPRPAYTLRCFVMVRAARQFFHHATFRPDQPPGPDAECRRQIGVVVRRNPRQPCPPEERVVIPGYGSLRAFSRERGALLQAGCGGAWRSYVVRSHWRMVLPISRRHQHRTAQQLGQRVGSGTPCLVHLVRFPQLTINHGMLVFAVVEGLQETRFLAYDPNDPDQPATLRFDPATTTFSMPANRYWAGGRLDVIEIGLNWWF